MTRKLTCAFVLLFFISISAEENSDFRNDFNSLMAVLESCECKFIRNGVEHDPKEARAHMEKKLKVVEGRIQTISEFIDHIGSKSSISGKPYLVKFADGKTKESGVWLKEKWEEILKEKNPSTKSTRKKRN
ncbi:YfeK family protein [Leptospira weilii]|uniref:YfeK family protein n=1 Tax=Leptospira weilii TaxID=28184 RepID=UPI00077339F0|nr:YfeK family protein [Leptospira weilii]ULH28418.1 YfeK family protein [Leptospira weilii]